MEGLSIPINAIKDSLSSLKSSIFSWFSKVFEYFEMIGDWFSDLGDKLSGFFSFLGDRISGFFSSLFEKIKEFFSPIWGFFQNIIDGILGIPKAIMNLLSDLLKFLFIPSDDFISGHVSELRNKFAFADSIISTAEILSSTLKNVSTAPPYIEIDLGASNTFWSYGGVQRFSFEWYAPYRGAVNALLSGILWVVFIWNTYRDLPGIINGVGSLAHTTANIAEEVNKE